MMRRCLVLLLLAVLVVPGVAAAPAQAATRWSLSDYQCTSGDAGTVCGIKQKATHRGHTVYRSRVTITPAPGHIATPQLLRQRNPQATRQRTACGRPTCGPVRKRWIGPWLPSTARMVDGWIVDTDAGRMYLAVGSSPRSTEIAARVGLKCVVVDAGRACLRVGIQQVRNRIETGLVAVIYPLSGAWFEFRGSSVGFGPGSSGSVFCPSCEHWKSRGSHVVGGFGNGGLLWPANNQWTPGGQPLTAHLDMESSGGPLTIDVTWP